MVVAAAAGLGEAAGLGDGLEPAVDAVDPPQAAASRASVASPLVTKSLDCMWMPLTGFLKTPPDTRLGYDRASTPG